MVDVSANADTLRELEKVKHNLFVRRSALTGKVFVTVGTSETLESHLRYMLGTYGPVRLMPDVREHALSLIKASLQERRMMAEEWSRYNGEA